MLDPERALEEQVREELKIGEANSTPLREGWITGVSTAFGAFIPVAPFLVSTGPGAIWTSLAVSMTAHFGVGAARSFFTGRGVIRQRLGHVRGGARCGGSGIPGWGVDYEAAVTSPSVALSAHAERETRLRLYGSRNFCPIVVPAEMKVSSLLIRMATTRRSLGHSSRCAVPPMLPPVWLIHSRPSTVRSVPSPCRNRWPSRPRCVAGSTASSRWRA